MLPEPGRSSPTAAPHPNPLCQLRLTLRNSVPERSKASNKEQLGPTIIIKYLAPSTITNPYIEKKKYIYIYIYAHPPPTTRKNAHFANLSITVIRQRLRKSKKSKTFYIYGILQLFLDFWIFGFLDFWIFGCLEFWSLRFFEMCSVFLLFYVLFVCCAWLLVYMCNF